MASAKTYIGLSLGSHNSVIAIINKEHRAEVIANEDGEHKTPSYIAFSGEEEYHGSQAKHQVVRNAQNTIVGFSELVGREYTDDMAGLHPGFARIERGAGGEPVFVAEGHRLTAHEATVRYLRRLRTTAEEYLGRRIDGAVLGVPARFGEAQRRALAAACADSGLPLLQLVAEPVAVAVQYGLGAGATQGDARDTVAVVVDVGGTGSDVTVVAASGGLLVEVGSRHTSEVSGDGMDSVLMAHFAGEFKKQHGIDVLAQRPSRAERKLREAVEVTKRTLSAAATAPCSVESLAEGLDYNGTIMRTRFDILAGKTYAPLLAAIEGAVADAGYTLAQVDQVLLCGGAARVRRLQSGIASLFPESTVLRDDAGELDEIVASGCAAQAALIAQGAVDAPRAEPVRAAALARPVGLQVGADHFVPVLLQNTPLPATRAIKVALPAGEKRAYIAVSEGEAVQPAPEPEDEDEDDDGGDDASADDDEEADACEPPRYRPAKLLAEMVLELDAADAATRIEVKFFAAADARLTVTATEPVSGRSITAEIPASN
ncbi:Hsp70 protein that interacts with Zuo1p [Coemansia javaensis]|uniref:Hsp70 protein that interacts with Zuo1p n=1 Tax=Coemansia javaensis TaxID=2761396 RepID=A0A9W8HA25_9FUNG|nr:Hsp70 protein that interacts with Zuo1p [Coemansia javaensis]